MRSLVVLGIEQPGIPARGRQVRATEHQPCRSRAGFQNVFSGSTGTAGPGEPVRNANSRPHRRPAAPGLRGWGPATWLQQSPPGDCSSLLRLRVSDAMDTGTGFERGLNFLVSFQVLVKKF